MKIKSKPLKSFIGLIFFAFGCSCVGGDVYCTDFPTTAPGVDDPQIERQLKNLENLMETITGELEKKNEKSQSKQDWNTSLSTFFEDIKNIKNMFNIQQNKRFLVSLINLITKIKNHPSGAHFNAFFNFTDRLHIILKELQVSKNDFFEMLINIMDSITMNKEEVDKNQLYDNISKLKQLLLISHQGSLGETSPINDPTQKEEFIQLFIKLMEAIANEKHKKNFTNNMSEFEFFLRYFTQALVHLKSKNNDQKEQFINVVIVLMNKIKDLEPEDLNKNLGYVRYLSFFVDRLLGQGFTLEKQKQPKFLEDFMESMDYIGQLKDETFKEGLKKFHNFILLFYNLSTIEIKLSKDKTIKPKFVDPLINFLKLKNQLNPDLFNNDTEGLKIFNAIMPIVNIRLNSDIPTDLGFFSSHGYPFFDLKLLLHYFFEYLDKISKDDKKREFIDAVVGLIEAIKDETKITEPVFDYINTFYENNIKIDEPDGIQLKEALVIILEEKLKKEKAKEREQQERERLHAEHTEEQRKLKEHYKLQDEALKLRLKERLKEQCELENQKRRFVSTSTSIKQEPLFNLKDILKIIVGSALGGIGAATVSVVYMQMQLRQKNHDKKISQQNYPKNKNIA